jgi:transcriptional regulator with XRE-family HTH domain
MSNEQPPPDDDQDVAEYRRTDPTDEPTHPAGQQAAVEGMLARARLAPRRQPSTFERIADDLNRRGVPVNTPAGRLTAQMYALFEEFEQDRRAEIVAAGGTPEDADDDGWGDALSRSNLVSVARAHRNATQPHRAKEGDLDRLLDDLADEFEPADVRIIRGVAAALADAMPRIAHKAREQQGMSPDEIAQKTGYTASRIAQFIRQEKERRAAPGTLRRYTWRIDTLDADDGRYGWTDREHGEDESTPADLAQLAERLLDETGAREQRARIVMWEGDEGDDAAAVHRAERDPQ